MTKKLSALLDDLRTAIRDALLRSDHVIAAFAALEQVGYSFDVGLDVTMHPAIENINSSEQKVVLELTRSDVEFLSILKIVPETTKRAPVGQYRLIRPVVGFAQSTKTAVTIPAGAVLSLARIANPEPGICTVEWDGSFIEAFRTDVEQNGAKMS